MGDAYRVRDAVLVIFHSGINNWLVWGGYFHVNQFAPGKVGNVAISALLLWEYIIEVMLIFKHIGFHYVFFRQHNKLKIFFQRFNYGLFIHLFQDIIYLKNAAGFKFKIEKLEPQFRWKTPS